MGVTQRCHIDTGGIHDILSHILGARLGGAVSLVYCFGQVRVQDIEYDMLRNLKNSIGNSNNEKIIGIHGVLNIIMLKIC